MLMSLQVLKWTLALATVLSFNTLPQEPQDKEKVCIVLGVTTLSGQRFSLHFYQLSLHLFSTRNNMKEI